MLRAQQRVHIPPHGGSVLGHRHHRVNPHGAPRPAQGTKRVTQFLEQQDWQEGASQLPR
jgi:hypothetical protein